MSPAPGKKKLSNVVIRGTLDIVTEVKLLIDLIHNQGTHIPLFIKIPIFIQKIRVFSTSKLIYHINNITLVPVGVDVQSSELVGESSKSERAQRTGSRSRWTPSSPYYQYNIRYES